MSNLPSISDYLVALENPQLIKSTKLSSGKCIKNRTNKIIHYTGGFCVVFPYIQNNQKFALRCWFANFNNAQERSLKIAETLKKLSLPYFLDFEYVENAILTPQGLQPVIKMQWADAQNFKEYLKDNLYNLNALNQLADKFLEMVKMLHKHNLSHGDLQHGNIMVKKNGELVLVDYDSMYIPDLKGFSDDIAGLKGYQHPSRFNNTYLSSKADYFSELVIYLSIKALGIYPNLFNELLIEDSDYLLFSENDFTKPNQSEIFKLLKNDSNLSYLTDKLIDFINTPTFEDLLPLEQVIIPPKKISDTISNKWIDNGYVPNNIKTPNIDKITNKWQN